VAFAREVLTALLMLTRNFMFILRFKPQLGLSYVLSGHKQGNKK